MNGCHNTGPMSLPMLAPGRPGVVAYAISYLMQFFYRGRLRGSSFQKGRSMEPSAVPWGSCSLE